MGSGLCCCCGEHPDYKVGKPLVSGKVTACFEDGRLFKVVKGKTWYFYNDTQDYKMEICATFGEGSVILPSGDAKVIATPSGACTATLAVYPLETKAMVEVKEMNGFTVSFKGIAFNEEDRKRFNDKARAKVSTELAKMRELNKKNPKMNNQSQLLQAAWKSKTMYVDTTFPPLQPSLVRPGIDLEPSGCLSQLDTVAWRRPQDFLPKEWNSKICLFDDGVSPGDIDQGQLGDCYFLCAIAALAEYENCVEAIFKNHHWFYVRKQEQKWGGWRVNLCIGGWWRTIIIDSYLPSVQLLPVFARNRHAPNELWVSFMEKAYAKVYGSYQAIVAGFPWQAQEDLTGFPAYNFGDTWKKAQTDPTTCNKLFDSLCRWNKAKYLLCISTPNDRNLTIKGDHLTAAQAKVLFEKAGLGAGHAYSVLDVKRFPMHNLCLLKIRNPWGSQVEWTGDWSDDSPLWKRYPLVKLACRPQKKADGIFWMEWRDASQFFDSGSVCFRRGNWFESWHDYRVFGNFDDLVCDTALEIIVNKTKEFSAYISLHQKDRRGLASSDPDSKYAALMLSISEGDPASATQKVVANSSENPEEPSTEYLFQQSRSVSLLYKFTKGHRYIVIPRRMRSNSGNNTQKKPYVIALLSKEKVSRTDVVVNIVRLDKSSDVFRNIPTFDVGAPTKLTTLYQTKVGNRIFETYMGDNLCTGKKHRNAEYVNVI